MNYNQGDISATPSQKQAIIHPPSPLMILAGAGTGKTFTLEHRIVYLIEYYNVNPATILTITYTEKAAQELKERILNKAGKSAYAMTVGTFHSFCYQLLRDFSAEKLPALLEESEAIHMLLKRFDDLGPFESDEFPLNPQRAVIESFIPFFNRSRDELLEIDKQKTPGITENGFPPETVAQLNDLKRIFPLFQQWKQDIKVVDYGDMILQAYNLLKRNDTVLQAVQEKYQHVIIDEFQDNNFALNEIIGLIAHNHRQITVVGDEDQTIYMADLNGTVVSLVNFGDDVLARATDVTHNNDDGMWSAVTDRIPPVGTKVTIRLIPVRQEQAKYPNTQVPNDKGMTN